jgi:peptide chain release factor
MTWLQISSGRGPEECQLAVEKLVKSLLNEAKEYNINLIDCEYANHGLLSALLFVDGNDDFLKSINGTVKWVCQSPLRLKYPRKNWFLSVTVLKEPEIGLQINMSDLKFETFKASGPGGQHVNKTESAVRVTHAPTGLVAMAQEERSQHRNKALAIARLNQMINDKNIENKRQLKKDAWNQHNSLERGNQIRVYKGLDFLRV